VRKRRLVAQQAVRKRELVAIHVRFAHVQAWRSAQQRLQRVPTKRVSAQAGMATNAACAQLAQRAVCGHDSQQRVGRDALAVTNV
jgi:hypothetical protein